MPRSVTVPMAKKNLMLKWYVVMVNGWIVQIKIYFTCTLHRYILRMGFSEDLPKFIGCATEATSHKQYYFTTFVNNSLIVLAVAL